MISPTGRIATNSTTTRCLSPKENFLQASISPKAQIAEVFTARHAVVEMLQGWGVAHILGNSGVTELLMLRNAPEGFSYILGRQQTVVVGMADGYVQTTGHAAMAGIAQAKHHKKTIGTSAMALPCMPFRPYGARHSSSGRSPASSSKTDATRRCKTSPRSSATDWARTPQAQHCLTSTSLVCPKDKAAAPYKLPKQAACGKF